MNCITKLLAPFAKCRVVLVREASFGGDVRYNHNLALERAYERKEKNGEAERSREYDIQRM